jgi:hypothetical protein
MSAAKNMRVHPEFYELSKRIKELEERKLNLKVSDTYVTKKISDNIKKMLPREYQE